MRAKAYSAQLSIHDLGSEVYEQMFWPGDQFDVRPPVLSSQPSLVLIYRPLKGLKAEPTLPRPEFEPRTCGVEALCTNHSATGLLFCYVT
ncbi:hypothetical protein TNCV_3723341 [Trichonephila clavipes]|nr:hypothetical protein TNCV_3723341 [Trichonephila clavipes]